MCLPWYKGYHQLSKNNWSLHMLGRRRTQQKHAMLRHTIQLKGILILVGVHIKLVRLFFLFKLTDVDNWTFLRKSKIQKALHLVYELNTTEIASGYYRLSTFCDKMRGHAKLPFCSFVNASTLLYTSEGMNKQWTKTVASSLILLRM